MDIILPISYKNSSIVGSQDHHNYVALYNKNLTNLCKSSEKSNRGLVQIAICEHIVILYTCFASMLRESYPKL